MHPPRHANGKAPGSAAPPPLPPVPATYPLPARFAGAVSTGWLGSYSLLLYRYEEAAPLGRRASAYALKMPTGRITEMRGLTHAVIQSGAPPSTDLLTASPDGKYLLWRTSDAGAFSDYVCPADGADTSISAVPPGDAPEWQPDSKGWIDFEWADDPTTPRHEVTHLLVHDVRTPDQTVLRPVEGVGVLEQHEYAIVAGGTLLVEWPALYNADRGHLRSVAIHAIASDPGTANRVAGQITAPAGLAIWEMRFAPTGNQIAWVFNSQTAPGSRSLWLSAVDGADMHKVRDLPAVSPGGGSVHTLAWSPDGSRLSILLPDAIAVLPCGEVPAAHPAPSPPAGGQHAR